MASQISAFHVPRVKELVVVAAGEDAEVPVGVVAPVLSERDGCVEDTHARPSHDCVRSVVVTYRVAPDGQTSLLQYTDADGNDSIKSILNDSYYYLEMMMDLEEPL